MKKILFLAIYLFATATLYGQTRTIDSMSHRIYQSPDPLTKKKNLLYALTLQRSMKLDTLAAYIRLALTLHPQQQELLKIDIARAFYYTRYGKSDSALQLVEKNLQFLRQQKSVDPELLTFYEFLDAGISLRRNKHKKALDNYFSGLKRSERNQDTNFQMRTLNGIGWVYMEMFQHAEAIKWFCKALALDVHKRYGANNSAIYTNMASCYGALGKMDSTRYYVEKAIAVSVQYEDYSAEANALVVKANVALFENRIPDAAVLMEKAIAIRRILNDPFYILSDLCILSNIYAGLYKTDEGLAAAQEAMDIARRYGISAKLPMIYISFESNYSQRKDYKKLSETLTEHLTVKDSVYRLALAEELAAQEAQYGSEKKEREIARQKLVIQHEKDTRKIWVFSLLGIMILIGAGVAVYLQRNKARQEKNLFRSILEGEQKERIRIARDLHDSIGQMLSVVKMNVSGIHYQAGAQEQLQTTATLEIIDKTIQEVRHISHNLIPEELNFGLVSALEEMCSKINDAGGTKVVLHIGEGLEQKTFNKQFELSVYRILQEILANTLKHAEAGEVQVQLSNAGGQILLRVTDDGKGFDPGIIREAKGLGWKNIQARVNLLNGRMNIQSEKIKGTAIEIWIPVNIPIQAA